MHFKEIGSGLGAENFIRIKDGDSLKMIFRGEPYDFHKHWIRNKPELCKGINCELCQKGDKPRFNFRINAIIYDSEKKSLVAKILEQGYRFYKSLASLEKAGYTLEKTPVIVSRTGTNKQDTVYTIMPDPNSKYNLELESQLSKIELRNLTDFELAGETTNTSDANEDDIPF